MSNTSNTGTTGTHVNTKVLQANDIKTLFQNHGRATIGSQEYILKSPSFSDPSIQTFVANQGAYTVKPIGSPSSTGETQYELTSAGKPGVKITVACVSGR